MDNEPQPTTDKRPYEEPTLEILEKLAEVTEQGTVSGPATT